MEDAIFNYNILDDEKVEMILEASLTGAIHKMLTIFMYGGYNIEKYLKQYYEWINSADYQWYITSLFRMIDEDGNEIDIKQLDDMKNNNIKEFTKIITFFEKHGLIIDKSDKGTDILSYHMNMDRIMNNVAVRTLLRTAMRIYLIDTKTLEPEKYIDSDYTYLMTNYVKCLERFMFDKLDKYKSFNAYDREHITFKNLEIKIIDYIEKNINDIPQGLVEEYKYLLKIFRKNYRNGYFHRHIQTRKNAYMANEIAQIILIMTELIMDI